MAVAESSSCGRSTVLLFLLIVFISFIIISKTIISETKVLDQYHYYFTTDDGVNTLRRRNSSRFNANNRCSRILLYDTELVSADTGLGHDCWDSVPACNKHFVTGVSVKIARLRHFDPSFWTDGPSPSYNPSLNLSLRHFPSSQLGTPLQRKQVEKHNYLRADS